MHLGLAEDTQTSFEGMLAQIESAHDRAVNATKDVRMDELLAERDALNVEVQAIESELRSIEEDLRRVEEPVVVKSHETVPFWN